MKIYKPKFSSCKSKLHSFMITYNTNNYNNYGCLDTWFENYCSDTDRIFLGFRIL